MTRRNLGRGTPARASNRRRLLPSRQAGRAPALQPPRGLAPPPPAALLPGLGAPKERPAAVGLGLWCAAEGLALPPAQRRRRRTRRGACGGHRCLARSGWRRRRRKLAAAGRVERVPPRRAGHRDRRAEVRRWNPAVPPKRTRVSSLRPRRGGLYGPCSGGRPVPRQARSFDIR